VLTKPVAVTALVMMAMATRIMFIGGRVKQTSAASKVFFAAQPGYFM
jgi:hypothetical protein